MIDVFAAILIASNDPNVPTIRGDEPAPVTQQQIIDTHPIKTKVIAGTLFVPRLIWKGVKKTGRGACIVGKKAEGSGFNGFLGLVGGLGNVATPFAVGFRR